MAHTLEILQKELSNLLAELETLKIKKKQYYQLTGSMEDEYEDRYDILKSKISAVEQCLYIYSK